MNWFVKTFGANWKTNTAAAISFLMSVPALATAFNNLSHGQAADWRGAAFGVITTIGLAVAKDSSNHSTAEQVETATIKADSKPTN